MANIPHLHTPEATSGDNDALAPLPFERRTHDRATAGGSMQGVLASCTDMPVLIRLELRDASSTGLGVVSDSPVQVGSRISLRVDPVHGMWKTATVVRCAPDTSGNHRLGLAYAQKRAA